MTPAQARGLPVAFAPSVPKPAMQLAIPEMKTLKELRDMLARGGLPAFDERTPVDDARIAAFRVVVELLRLLAEFKRRTESGEACRLVVQERPSCPGRLVLEIAIHEAQR